MNPAQVLYTVATQDPRKDGHGTRCVAICTSLWRARQIIENNEFDIWELTNEYAVIERLNADHVYGVQIEGAIWYQWNGLTGWDGVGTRGYYECACPEQYKRIIGFGVG